MVDIGRIQPPAPQDALPPPQNPLEGRIAAARAQGFSWDDIGQQIDQRKQAALSAGYSEADIAKAFGATDPGVLMNQMRVRAGESLSASMPNVAAGEVKTTDTPATPEVSDPFEGFLHGLQASSSGLVLRGKLPDQIAPEDMGWATKLAEQVGESLGDLPAMVVGGIGGAFAGSAVPGVGTAIGAGAGMFALPTAIKQEYVDALKNGQVKSPQDYAVRQAAVLWDTAKSAAVGAVTGAAGAAMGAEAIAAGRSAAAVTAIKTGSELAAMTTVGKAIEGKLPTPEDFLDGAVILGALKGSEHISSTAGAIRDNLAAWWVKSDQHPVDAAKQAVNDPLLRQELLTIPQPKPAPASSSVTATDTADGGLVIPKAPEVINPPELALPKEEKQIEETTGKESVVNPLGKEGTTAFDRVAARFSSGQEAGPSLWQRTKALGSTIYREMFDQNAPINKLAEAITDGKSLKDAGNPKFLYELAAHSNERAQYMIERKMIDTEGNVVGKGLNEILEPFDHEAGNDNFWTYAGARWAVEKAKQDKTTGVDVDDAHEVVASGEARYEDAFQELVGWQNHTLAYLRDSGVLNAKGFDKMVAENEARIPGYRIDEAGKTERTTGIGRDRVVNATSIRKFTGSEAKIENTLKALLQDAFVRVELGNRNRANVALWEGASELGLAEKQPRRLTHTDLTQEELDKLGSEKQEGDPETRIWRTLGVEAKPDEVPVFIDGKKMAVKFEDPEIAKVLRGYDKPTMSAVSKIMASVTRVQRTAIVLAPQFPVHIAAYDIPWQFITKPGLRNTLFEYMRGLGHIVGNTRTYDEWMRSPGAVRVFEGLQQQDYIKHVLAGRNDLSYASGAWNLIKTPYHALKAWSSLLGQALPVGRFAAGRAEGESILKAGAASSRSSFHPPGWGGPQSKLLNAVQPFFSAHLNGMEQTVRGQLGIGKTITGEKYNGFSFTAKAALLITAPIVGTWIANHDKQWYKAAPDWQKDNGLLLHFGPDDGGTTVFLKYPPILSFLYGALPRRLLEGFVADNPHAADGIAESGLASFLPPGGLLTYNVLLPMVEHMANYSFFRGQPLVSDAARQHLPQERFTPYTTQTAKNISNFLSDIPLVKDMNLSPTVVDNYIQAWGGTLGQMALRGSEAALQKAGVIKHNAPAMEWSDLPGVSSFLSRYPSASAQPSQQFSAQLDHLDMVHNSLDQLFVNGNLARFRQLAQQEPLAAILHAMAPTGANAVLAASRPDRAAYLDALRQASANVDPAVARQIMMADKAVSTLRQLATIVGDPAEYSDQPSIDTDVGRNAVNGILKEVGSSPLKPGPMSANDKRQLLDRIWAQEQVISERGNDLLTKAVRGGLTPPP